MILRFCNLIKQQLKSSDEAMCFTHLRLDYIMIYSYGATLFSSSKLIFLIYSFILCVFGVVNKLYFYSINGTLMTQNLNSMGKKTLSIRWWTRMSYRLSSSRIQRDDKLDKIQQDKYIRVIIPWKSLKLHSIETKQRKLVIKDLEISLKKYSPSPERSKPCMFNALMHDQDKAS